MRPALIANSWADRYLDLWYHFVAALNQQREIGFIVVGVKRDLLSHLNPVCVFEYKREFFLLSLGKVYIDVARFLWQSFDSVRRRRERRVQSSVAGLQLKRNHSRLSTQSFRRDQFKWHSVAFASGD